MTAIAVTAERTDIGAQVAAGDLLLRAQREADHAAGECPSPETCPDGPNAVAALAAEPEIAAAAWLERRGSGS